MSSAMLLEGALVEVISQQRRHARKSSLGRQKQMQRHAHFYMKGGWTKPLARQWCLLLWLHADLNFWFCDLANLFDDWGFLNPQTGGCHEGREDNGAAPADD
jgi:hypothetical protein